MQRLVDDVLNGGNLDLIDLIDQLYTPDQAAGAREWIAPFRASFPDVHMDTIELLAEGDIVIGRFTCTATHSGTWLGHPPTGRGLTRDRRSQRCDLDLDWTDQIGRQPDRRWGRWPDQHKSAADSRGRTLAVCAKVCRVCVDLAMAAEFSRRLAVDHDPSIGCAALAEIDSESERSVRTLRASELQRSLTPRPPPFLLFQRPGRRHLAELRTEVNPDEPAHPV